MTDQYEHRAFDNGADRSLERLCLVIGFVVGALSMWGADVMRQSTGVNTMKTTLAALSLITLTATAAMANIDWTIDRGDGVHIPNPACSAQTCPDTAPKPHEPHGNSAEPPLPETHNGFSCAFNGTWWAYHPAARFNMTEAHIAASKAEALDRLASLGDKAREMVCRPWQIRAGFLIAGAL